MAPDDDWHPAHILGRALHRAKIAEGGREDWLEGVQRALSFQRPSLPQQYYSQGVKLDWIPSLSDPQTHVLFIKSRCLSQEECWAVCVITAFPTV